MPLIEKQKKESFTKKEFRIEEKFFERFLAYCEYLESSPDHVVTEALRYVIDRDKDFARREASETSTTDVVKVRSKGAA